MEKGRYTVAPSLDSERKAGSECKLESRTSTVGEEFRKRPWRFVQPVAYQGRRSLRLLTQQLNLRKPTEGVAQCKWNQLPSASACPIRGPRGFVREVLAQRPS